MDVGIGEQVKMRRRSASATKIYSRDNHQINPDENILFSEEEIVNTGSEVIGSQKVFPPTQYPRYARSAQRRSKLQRRNKNRLKTKRLDCNLEIKENKLLETEIRLVLTASCPLTNHRAVASLIDGKLSLWTSSDVKLEKWDLLGSMPLHPALTENSFLMITNDKVEVKAFYPTDKVLKVISVGFLDGGVTSTSTVLMLTEKEELINVQSCKLDNNKAAFFYFLKGSNLSQGAVVEWKNSQEELRHLATLKGQFVRILNVFGDHKILACIQDDCLVSFWSWKSGAKQFQFTLPQVPSPNNITKFYLTKNEFYLFNIDDNKILRINFITRTNKIYSLQEILTITLPFPLHNVDNVRISVCGKKLFILDKTSIFEWDLSATAASPISDIISPINMNKLGPFFDIN